MSLWNFLVFGKIFNLIWRFDIGLIFTEVGTYTTKILILG